MAITSRVFQCLVYSLIIYSFSCDKFTEIAGEDPSRRNITERDGNKGTILNLDEAKQEISDARSFRFERLESRFERRRSSKGKTESSKPVDDEDDRLDEDTESSGDLMNSLQGDAASPADEKYDQNIYSSQLKLNSSASHALDRTSSSNSDLVVESTLSSAESILIGTVVSPRGANFTRSVTSAAIITTPPLPRTSVSSINVPGTVDIATVTTSTSSEEIYFRTNTTISATRDIIISRSTNVFFVNGSSSPTSRPTVLSTMQSTKFEGTTKEGHDVQSQQDPSPKSKQKNTLFGFVTIEILVALLAGAACTVILLIFLVYRFKKRNEGSYELQETLMLKPGASAEEKEVFV
ncbi:uncharacterized protein [Montipora capricornis]|uniref:uncharacterized protein n=1 Tax=Montipora capricornis TaxID=246305 RepID=UPI0035F204D7